MRGCAAILLATVMGIAVLLLSGCATFRGMETSATVIATDSPIDLQRAELYQVGHQRHGYWVTHSWGIK